MKIFFRKHGNSLFYILLPVLFLVLTVAFIQLTPKSSRTEVDEPCTDSEECCNTSGCGADIGEACDGDTCTRTNVGCEEGIVVDSADGVCDCVDGVGTVIGKCIVCPTNGNFINGGCYRPCGPGENSIADNCYIVEGSGEVFGCSGSLSPLSGGEIPWSSLGVAGSYLLGLLGLRARRHSR